MPFYKSLLHKELKFAKYLKYKIQKRKHLILEKYINIFIYLKKKFNFVVDFMSMFSCFRRTG